MRAVVEKDIDDLHYTITMLPASEGLAIFTRLIKLVGKPFAALSNSGGLDAEVSAKLLGLALEALAENLDEEVVQKTIKDLMKSAIVNGQQASKIFDVHFAGRMGHMMKVLVFILEVQYKDFLDGLGGLNFTSLIRPKAQG